MNIEEYVKNRGLKTVINPDYNPNSKKNKQPKFIDIVDTSGANDLPGITAYEKQLDKQWIAPTEETEKYRKYGIAYNTVSKNLDKELADAQSNWTKVFNSIGQTFVSEIGLGTLKAFSDIADFIVFQVFQSDNDYSNPISRKLEEWQEAYKNDVAPIYIDPEVNISNGGLTDPGWYAKHAPSIASSLTLLIPARATTTVLGKAASLARIDKGVKAATRAITGAKRAERVEDLNKLQKFLYNPVKIEQLKTGAKITSDALIMRTIENYQESRQTYTSTYTNALNHFNDMTDIQFQNFISENPEYEGMTKEQVAKTIAKKSADRTFALDYSNTLFDIIQLYGLRNMGNIWRSVNSPTVQLAHKESIRGLAKTATDNATKAVKEPFLGKYRDIMLGGSKMFFTQSTEGIEEAVNFIAQQEGLTYGKHLLNKTEDASYDGFVNRRLNEYFKNPELYESAFWGWMGGIVFGAGGSAINKYQLYKSNKKINKLREENPLTGEKVNLSDEDKAFFAMIEAPDIKRAKVAIQKRTSRLEDLENKIRLIKSGKNIFSINKETNEFEEFDENDIVGKETAIRKVIQDYRADITMDAINSGTYDMLREYLASDVVKQAMIDKGIIDAENADEFMRETLQHMDFVKKTYNDQLAHISNQVLLYNADKNIKDEVPAEYIQIIAKENTDRILRIESLKKQAQGLFEIQSVQEQINSVFGENAKEKVAQTQALIKNYMLGHLYSSLEANKRKIQEDDKLTKFKKEERVAAINSEQKAVLDAIQNPYNINELAAIDENLRLATMFDVIRQSKAYRNVGEMKNYLTVSGEYKLDANDEHFRLTDDEIIAKYKSLITDKPINTESISELMKSIKTLTNNIFGEDGLYNINKKLYNTCQSLSELEINIGLEQSRLINTSSQVRNRIDEIHNQMNEARKERIQASEKTIMDMYNKYEEQYPRLVEHILSKAYQGKLDEVKHLIYKNFDNSNDADEMFSALEILNLSQGANTQIYEYFKAVIAKRKELNGRESLSNTTIQINPNSNEISEIEDNSVSTEEPTTDDENEPSDNPMNGKQHTHSVNIILNNRGEIINIKVKKGAANGIPAIENENGILELDISALPKELQKKYLYTELFHTPNAEILNEGTNVEISENPTLKPRKKGYIVSTKGTLDVVKTEEEVFKKENPEENPEEKDKTPIIEYYNDNSDSFRHNGKLYKVGDTISNETQIGTIIGFDTNQIWIQWEDGSDSLIEYKDLNGYSKEEVKEEVELQKEEPTTQPSSTGDVVFTPSSEIIPTIFNQDDSIKNYNNRISYVIKKYIPDSSKVDVFDETDKVVEELASEYTEKSKDEIRKDVESFINKMRLDYKQTKQVEGIINQAGAEVVFAAKYEEPFSMSYSSMFTSAIANLVEQYAKNAILPKINGKQVIKLEDILRICNNVYASSDVSVATSIYTVLKNYLLSPQGLSKYIIADIDNVKSNKVINNINLTAEQLQNNVEQTIGLRVNVAQAIHAALNNTPEAKKEYFDKFNSLKTGDTLDLVVSNGEVLLMKDGIIIGTLPYPEIDKQNAYYKYNEGWKSDVKLDSAGNVISRLKDVFEDIFITNDKVHNELRAIIINASINGLNPQLIADFGNNPIIQTLIQQVNSGVSDIIFKDFKTGNIDLDLLLTHLTKLWKYSANNLIANDRTENEKILRQNLNRWFRTLYDSYETINNIKSNGTVKISYISEGQIIRVVEKDTQNSYDLLPTYKEGVSSDVKTRIAIVNPTKKGDIVISNENAKPVYGFESASTLLAVFSRNAEPDFVKAYGLRLTNKEISNNSKLSKIGSLAMRDLQNAINEAAATNSQKAHNNLIHIIKSIFRFGNIHDYIGLFDINDICYIDYEDKNGFSGYTIKIGSGTNKRYIQIFNRIGTKTGSIAQFGININGKIVPPNLRAITLYQAFNDLLKQASINISYDGINSDNTLKDDFKGYLTREIVDGESKFKLNISNIQEEYDSYNDYLLENDFIRVNTKKNADGKNFERKGENQSANQVLYVDIPVTSSPVKNVSSTPNGYITPNSNVEIYNNILNIINNSHSGEEIFKLLKGIDNFNVLNENNLLSLLLPSNIIFDSRFNIIVNGNEKGFIAETAAKGDGKYRTFDSKNVKDNKKLLKHGQTVVGARLLNMLSSNNTDRVNRGIRKLMHEKLHILIHDKDSIGVSPETIYNAIAPIWAEFRENFNKDYKDNKDHSGLQYINQLFKDYIGIVNREIKAGNSERIKLAQERLLEEFIIESLTNEVLAKYLNSVSTTNTIINKKETILSKIVDFITKYFIEPIIGKVEDNSLLAKEFDTLRSLIESNEVPDVKIDISETLEENNIEEAPSASTQETETSTTSEVKKDDENNDDNDGLDISMFGEDYIDELDDDTYQARIPEPNVDKDGFRKIASINGFIGRLPIRHQNGVATFIEAGEVQIKCSI